MKKQLSVVSKAAAAAQILGISLLLMISCSNILAPPREAAGSGETGTALISFGNGVEGARTLLPTEATFERYELTINPVAPNPASTKYVTINVGSSALVELGAGNWEIHVDAYTDTGPNKAAEGDSETFQVNPNATTPVPVILRAVTVSGVDPGTLSVNIIGEDSGVIDHGRLSIYNGADFADSVYLPYYGADVNFEVNGLDLDISLPPGEYRVYAEIHSKEGQWAYINEVAWIYSKLTTSLNQVFGPGDFADTTLISGTIQYVENGVDQEIYQLALFTNPDGIGNPLGEAWVDVAGEQSYTLHIPRPDKNVTLYFYIYKDGNRFSADSSISLGAEQAAATKDISVNRSTITLSGSVAVTVSGNTPDFVRDISAYPEGGGALLWATISGDTWTISGIPDDFSGTLSLRVYAEYGGRTYDAAVGSWTPGDATDNIVLTASFITVSGSFTATENSAPISDVNVYIYADRESIPGSGEFNEYLGGSFNYYWSGNTCYWTFGTVGFSPSAQIQLRIGIGNNSVTEIVTVGTTDVPILPATYDFSSLTLSGTIGTVRVNGNLAPYFSIHARTPDYSGYYQGSVDGNNWQIPLPSDFSGPLIIVVQAPHAEDWRQQDVAYPTVYGSSIPNIDLGDVSITYITLSGTIGTVTINGETQSEIYIYARDSGGNNYGTSAETNSNWQISLPDDVSGTLAIVVQAAYYAGPRKDVTTREVSGASIPGINLGDVEFTFIPISGTVTIDGTIPLGSGFVAILSQSVSGPDEVTEEMILGDAEIVGGDFSGHVNSDVASGYVVVYDPNTGAYWITSSPELLGASMSINLLTMISGVIPPTPPPGPGPRGGGGN
jgi:hypothetical protein